MAIKLIVSDLDGTMLDSACRIPAENVRAVREAQAAGIRVTLATGRMHCSALPYAKELGIDEPLISYNGALVKTPSGEEISAAYLPERTVAEVLEYAFAQGHYIQLYAQDKLYFAERVDKTLVYEKAAGLKGEPVGKEGMLAHTAGVTKLLVAADNPDVTDALVDELAQAFRGRADVVRSNPIYIEILLPGVSKAKAMLDLADSYGIKAEEIMALGDSDNDTEMLKAAGLGVAMGAAAERIKAQADAVTGNSDDAGLADAVRKYALGR